MCFLVNWLLPALSQLWLLQRAKGVLVACCTLAKQVALVQNRSALVQESLGRPSSSWPKHLLRIRLTTLAILRLRASIAGTQDRKKEPYFTGFDGRIRPNRLRAPQIEPIVCELRFGALEIANRRFETTRANRSKITNMRVSLRIDLRKSPRFALRIDGPSKFRKPHNGV